MPISKLPPISDIYIGKKLSPEEAKKIMIDRCTIKLPKPVNENILPESTSKEKFLKNYMKKLDELIAKDPKNTDLRKYKASIEKLKSLNIIP